MFTNISWKEYSIFILIIIFSYYAILLIVFYKREILNLIENFHHLDKRSNIYHQSDSISKRNSDLITDDIDSSDIVNHLQQEIKSKLERAKIKRFVKEEITQSLQLVLKNYDSVKGTQYNQFVNIYIQVMCENICSIHLEEEEIERLWIG